MTKSLLTTFFITSCFFASAQTEQLAQDWCLTDEMHQHFMETDPNYAKNQQTLEAFTEQHIKTYKASPAYKSNAAVKIIPVVFHVIHQGGTENISDAQLMSMLDVLNEDYRRLNADASSTPAPFQSIAADCQIEFRIAQLDPNGNCTNGINRIFNPATANFADGSKSLSYWPSNKYLNVWTCKVIGKSTGSGIVIGYAQFPGGAAATDGVVLRSDYTGRIGTAASSGNNGRVASHEVGHWLNLRHIWGDDSGSCSGSDLVADTPNQADMTFSTCPTFPLTDACTPSGNGVLFPDYMDYTRGNCQNIFTAGQAARMDAALNSSTSGRNNLWSPSNLAATGAGGTPVLCSADFTTSRTVACAGTNITFSGLSYNVTATTWAWDVNNDGTTDYTTQNATHAYSTPGIYTVKLTVGDGTTTKSVTKNSLIVVLGSTATQQPPYVESFENTGFPYTDFYVFSNTADAFSWNRVTTAAYTGSASIKMDNFGSGKGDMDEFITPSIDLSNVTSPTMTFRLAHQRRSSTDTLSQLRVLTSVDCGLTWNQRYIKNDAALATVTTTSGTAFTPSSTSQWRQETVAISNVTGKNNVRFRFEFIGTGVANNIYIDDININGTPTNPGVQEEMMNSFALNVYPNPMTESTTISFTTHGRYEVGVGIYDLLGKEIVPVSATTLLPAGTYELPVSASLLKPGVYFVRLSVEGLVVNQKIVVQ